MQKLILLFVLATVSFAGNAQVVTTLPAKETNTTSETAFFMGLNSGLDFNINAYNIAQNNYNKTQTDPNHQYKFYGIRPRYNIGFDMGLQVSQKLRPRLELKFVNLKYGISYNPSVFQNVGNTIINVNYFDINFHMDYLWLTKSKFQLFVSPALKYEYKIGEAVGGDNFNFLSIDHPSYDFGGAVSAIVKYNFTKHWGATFTPEYTCFIKPFSAGNGAPYQRITTNFGFEYKF